MREEIPADQEKIELGLQSLSNKLVEDLAKADLDLSQTIFCLLSVYVDLCSMHDVPVSVGMDWVQKMFDIVYSQGDEKCLTH